MLGEVSLMIGKFSRLIRRNFVHRQICATNADVPPRSGNASRVSTSTDRGNAEGLLLAFLLAIINLGCSGLVTAIPLSKSHLSISTEPANQTVMAGQTAVFAVAATGRGPLTYQWRKNGNAIQGGTSSAYTTAATTSSDNGAQFTVVVSNAAGSATSSAAMLTVSAAAVAPSVTMQPASQTVTTGQTASFSVTAAGTAPLTYQW